MHGANCENNTISIKGWIEIYNFLTGQFSIIEPAIMERPTPKIPSDDMSTSYSSDQESPQELLQSIRLKNIDRIIIGHLNINSIRNKIEILNDIIQDKIDVFLVSETKIDKTFPTAQFYLNGFETPHRLDRTAEGGGLLLYCLLYTSPSPRDRQKSRMPSSA